MGLPLPLLRRTSSLRISGSENLDSTSSQCSRAALLRSSSSSRDGPLLIAAALSSSIAPTTAAPLTEEPLKKEKVTTNDELRRCNSCGTLFMECTPAEPDVLANLSTLAARIHDRVLDGIVMRQQQRSFSRDEEHPAFGRFFEVFEVFDESKPQPEADLTVDQIYIYVRRVFTKAELYVECLVTAGVLLERVLDMNAGLLLTSKNWKYLTLSTMILASKLCDDESHNNSEWQYLNRDYRPRLVNDMESALLLALNFNVAVSASAYAAFYFDLRSISFLSTVQRKTELLSSNDNASTTTTTTTTTTTAKKPRRNSQLIQPALAERIITKRGTAVVTPPTAVRQMGTGTTTSTHSLRRCKSARDFDDPESFSPGSLTVIEHLVDMSPKRVDVMRKQPPPERPYIKKGDVDRVAVCSPDMETTGNKRTFDLCQRANLLVREKQQPQQVAVRQPHRPLRQPHQQEKQQQHGRRHTVTSNSTVTTIKMRFGGMSPRVAVCSPDFDDAVPDFDEYDDAQNNNNNDKNNNSAASAAESSLRLPGINNGPTGVSQWRTWSPLALFQAPSDFFKAKH